ncbi:MAG: hypothetical protein ABW098_20880 [Candidatus Thiodiazotropha sp.]
MRLNFHKEIFEMLQYTHSRHDRWIFKIYDFTEEKWKMISQHLLPPNYDSYVHGKILGGTLSAFIVFFQDVPILEQMPFPYQLNFPATINDLFLLGYEKHISNTQGRDVSLGNREAFEQVIESEEKLQALSFPTKYSDYLLGIRHFPTDHKNYLQSLYELNQDV